MATTFRPDATRDAAAAEIAEGAAGWLQIRLRRAHGAFAAGAKFYGVPSSKADGSFYYTNLKVCSCADYEKRSAGCKHQRAVALHVARVRAERQEAGASAPDLAPAATCRICTAELPAGLIVGLCDPCDDAGLMFEGVAAIKAAFGSEAGAVITTIGGTR